MNNRMNVYITRKLLMLLLMCTFSAAFSQQVEVQGELKVTQMTADDSEETLVIQNSDGTLGTRSVASLPTPSPPIDTTRNLASDFELAKHLCECPNLPPFMIKKLIESGYTPGELVGSGVPVQDVIDAQKFGILVDSRDSRVYKTVKIGAQTWMAENLDFGVRIDGNVDQTDNSNVEKYCLDNDASNCITYGGLYQWNEVMEYETTSGAQGICPTGWHVPTDDEWKDLEMELGMTSAQANANGYRGTNQGSQLAGNEALWIDGLLDQNNGFESSGFNAIPGGVRTASGAFSFENIYGDYWTSTENPNNDAIMRYFKNDQSNIGRDPLVFIVGMSVRCIQD